MFFLMTKEAIKRRVLIFDDEPCIRVTLSRVFERRGYDVMAYSDTVSCKQCLCTSKQTCADVLISDLRMPCSSGLDFLRQLRSSGCRIQHMALVSGLWSLEEAEEARMLGIMLFNKPFSIAAFDHWADVCEKTTLQDRVLVSHVQLQNGLLAVSTHDC